MLASRYKLFGTWKNKLTYAATMNLSRYICDYVSDLTLPFELSFCPTMVALKAVANQLRGKVALTAQNLVWDDSVSFTGETSGSILQEIGCKSVIIGHSERRLYLGEDDAMVAKKVSTATKHGLVPVVCIGETYDDYVLGRSNEVVQSQMKAVLEVIGTPHPHSRFVIAYEPAWAISTSREALKCEPDEANAKHILIRRIIESELGRAIAERVSVIYGGSVTPGNAAQYFGMSDIDGGLVGTASQSQESFRQLIDASRTVFARKATTV